MQSKDELDNLVQLEYWLKFDFIGCVRKLLPPHSRSVASVSQETGVSEPTLYAWKKRFQDQNLPLEFRLLRQYCVLLE